MASAICTTFEHRMHCIERASSKEHGIVLVIGGNSGGGDSAGVSRLALVRLVRYPTTSFVTYILCFLVLNWNNNIPSS